MGTLVPLYTMGIGGALTFLFLFDACYGVAGFLHCRFYLLVRDGGLAVDNSTLLFELYVHLFDVFNGGDRLFYAGGAVFAGHAFDLNYLFHTINFLLIYYIFMVADMDGL